MEQDQKKHIKNRCNPRHELQILKSQTRKKKFKVVNYSLPCHIPNVWKLKPWAQTRRGRPRWGGQERHLQVLIFTTHPALSDPLGACPPPPPCRAEGEPYLPRQPAIRRHSFKKGETVPKKERKCKPCCLWPLVLVKKMFEEVVESRGEGFKGYDG